jgi:Ca2+-binding RTX toxin-like protein
MTKESDVMKRLILISIFGLMLMALGQTDLQGDFIQCPGDVCGGTIGDDLINGTLEEDTIGADDGNDIVFGNGDDDSLNGRNGNDLLFGGPGNDELDGGSGDDIMLAGLDRGMGFQNVQGSDGNDTTFVFVGETSGCLKIEESFGFNDVVHLVGFGPYSASSPFNQPGFVEAWLHIVDPITGGDIIMEILEANNGGIDTVNGLLTPNVTIIFDLPESCIPN